MKGHLTYLAVMALAVVGVVAHTQDAIPAPVSIALSGAEVVGAQCEEEVLFVSCGGYF